MHTAIIVGSHRKNSQSSKVSAFIQKTLDALGHTYFVFDLGKQSLPFWDEGVWDGEERWKTIWGPISKELDKCDSAVVISPEWSGMVPAALKNFFLLVGKELAHKPALITTVSSSRGGAYPVIELRQSSYKNTYICYIPEHVIVRNVESVLNGDKAENDDDQFIREKINYSLEILALYAEGMKVVRESGKLDFKKYPFGM